MPSIFDLRVWKQVFLRLCQAHFWLFSDYFFFWFRSPLRFYHIYISIFFSHPTRHGLWKGSQFMRCGVNSKASWCPLKILGMFSKCHKTSWRVSMLKTKCNLIKSAANMLVVSSSSNNSSTFLACFWGSRFLWPKK